MRYRGFIITSTPDSGIERYDSKRSQDVICNGYYCQIYGGDDADYANQLDDFCLAEGHEIKDCSYGELERGIARYVDGQYDDLWKNSSITLPNGSRSCSDGWCAGSARMKMVRNYIIRSPRSSA